MTRGNAFLLRSTLVAGALLAGLWFTRVPVLEYLGRRQVGQARAVVAEYLNGHRTLDGAAAALGERLAHATTYYSLAELWSAEADTVLRADLAPPGYADTDPRFVSLMRRTVFLQAGPAHHDQLERHFTDLDRARATTLAPH